jgi:hypothetical protein
MFASYHETSNGFFAEYYLFPIASTFHGGRFNNTIIDWGLTIYGFSSLLFIFSLLANIGYLFESIINKKSIVYRVIPLIISY